MNSKVQVYEFELHEAKKTGAIFRPRQFPRTYVDAAFTRASFDYIAAVPN
jgi:hypothetical protein